MGRPRNPDPKLKASIAACALRIVEHSGVASASLRSVATAAGVSANAPYHHFPAGIAEILGTVAMTGFERLREFIGRRTVNKSGVDHAFEVFERFVQFGVEHAELYRAMFHASLARPLAATTADQKGAATFQQLNLLKFLAYDDLVAPLARLREQGLLRGTDAHAASGLAFAALAHGLVGQFIDEGVLLPESSGEPWSPARQAMTAEVADSLLNGLMSSSAQQILPDTEPDDPAATMRPADDPSWRLYPETFLEFFPESNSLWIDLRQPLSLHVQGLLADRGLPASFVVLTANNPRGQSMSPEENIQLRDALRLRVREAGLMSVQVDGVSPDGRHREQGIAVALGREAAVQLAREFGQSAYFAYAGGAFSIVGALVETPDLRLPR